MQELKQYILECEEAYIRCFCETIVEEQVTRYVDPLLRDMYEHNFIQVNEDVTEKQLAEIIQVETQKRTDNKEKFCKIKVHQYPKELIPSCNGKLPEQETLEIYLCDLELAKQWRSVSNCIEIRIAQEQQVEELVVLDTLQDAVECGADFCKRRALRRSKVYIADTGCDSYICYYEGKPVGSCDLFVSGDIAKLEDFSILPEYQRKGIGTTLLKTLVEKAQEQGAKIVYLNTEEDNTAREMYMKLGFRKIGEFYSLFWNL